MTNIENILNNYKNSIDVEIENSWISLNEILKDKNINNIDINRIKTFKNKPIYFLFQICNYYKIDFNNLEIRQKIKDNIIYTEGEKDFNIKNRDCKCIICNRNFKASRNNIKICNSNHFVIILDIFTGEAYKKEIMKWNKIEHDIDGNIYLYGKYYENKNHQSSANNVNAMYKGVNNICDLSYQDRIDIMNEQKGNKNSTRQNNVIYCKVPGCDNNNENSSINEHLICEYHWKSLPCTEDKNNCKNKKLRIYHCNEHGFYISTSPMVNYPGCAKEGKIKETGYTYEKRCKASSISAKKRVENGTHNFLFQNSSEESRKLANQNSVKTKKKMEFILI